MNPCSAANRAEVAEGERARAALRTERDFVSTVFDTTGALIVVFDRAGRVVRVNRAWEQASGLPAGEVEGRSFWDLQLADAAEAEAARRAIETVFAGRGPVRRQGRWRHRDGSLRLFDWTCAALHQAGGAIEYAVASAVEVTAQHAAEQALRAERDLVESVLQTVPALIAVTDRDGRLVRFNRAFVRATGYTAAEVTGRDIRGLLLPVEEIAAARTLFAVVRNGDSPRHGETSLCHRDGSRHRVAWTVTALAAAPAPGGYVLAAGVDVTEAHAAAARERERLEELAQMHRLHTAGELAAMLAHELNQPLAAIANYAEAGLRKSGAEGEALQRDFFARIAEQALRAGRTIEELRNFLAKAPIEISTVDVNVAARSAQKLTLPYARTCGIDVELDLDQRIGAAVGGALAIEHIIVNLVRNAVEAIAAAGMASGTVTVRTRQLDADGGRLRISVEDSGPGLSAAEADKVFNSLYTTKANGLGMGLRISRRLAEAQGGRLWVEPHVPGARFHLDLRPAR